MKRSRRPLLSLVLIAAAHTSLAAQSDSARVDAYMRARQALGQFNGTVLVARGGKVLIDQGYGFANFEHGVAATAAVRYGFASLTKSFTAAAILRLQDQHRLSTSDSLCRWIDDCPIAWRAVTLEQMLHHTSGIPDYEASLGLGSPAYMNFMLQGNSAARIIAAARSQPLDFPPGQKFSYSNTAYILLGLVIERASGMSYDDFVARELFAPAQLTSMTVQSRRVIPRMANGYRRLDVDWAAQQRGLSLDSATIVREDAPPNDGPHGDGKLVGTAADEWKWMNALAGGAVISAAAWRAMTTPVFGYGDGWFVTDRFGVRTLAHTGALPGYVSTVEFYPDSGSAVIVMSNVTNIRLSRILRDLAAIVFHKPYDVSVARTLVAFDSAKAEPLAGRYALADGSIATVSVDGQRMLEVAIPNRFDAGLLPMGDDSFYAPLFDNTVRFARDGSGRGATIVMRINGEDLQGTRIRE